MSSWLEGTGWVPVCAASPAHAQRAVSEHKFALAVVDFRFGGRDEGIQLGEALFHDRGIPFVLASGYLSTPVIVSAMRAGALDVIDKPLTAYRFTSFIQRAIQSLEANRSNLIHQSISSSVLVGADDRFASVADRWARIVLKVCDAVYDPRTMPLWGRSIGLSSSTIQEICRLCGVTAHDSRDLARFLRALARSLQTETPLRDHFTVADERTLEHLFKRACVDSNSLGVSLSGFLTRQTFVPTSKACLRELSHLAANSAHFFGF